MSDAKPRILIVDDEPDLLTVLTFGLEAEGFAVLQATDGEQGLALARQALPDLIVLDLMLPRMDGYKVLRAVQTDERCRAIPIVVLSARTGVTDRRLATDLGAVEVHTKPYDLRALVASIRTWVARRGPGRHAA
jgi:two-component system phosphate regulon response regulator PhoB